MTDATQLNRQLIIEAQAGNENTCLELIVLGADVNTIGERQYTPLHIAASQGLSKLFARLLAMKANVHAENEFKQTPLLIAAWDGKSLFCEALLKADASVDARDKDGCTPLIVAARQAHTAACKVLLENGANIDATNDRGENAMLFAARKPAKELGFSLLMHGAQERNHPAIKLWLSEFKTLARQAFPAGKVPSREMYLEGNKITNRTMHACAIGEFDSLIGEQILKAQQYDLFKEVWDALPEYARQQNQGIYIEYTKRVNEITSPAIHVSEERRV